MYFCSWSQQIKMTIFHIVLYRFSECVICNVVYYTSELDMLITTLLPQINKCSVALLFFVIDWFHRAARVCQLWNSAAANPILWRHISIGYCWTEPGKTQLPKTEMKIKNTVSWLAQNRSVHWVCFNGTHHARPSVLLLKAITLYWEGIY